MQSQKAFVEPVFANESVQACGFALNKSYAHAKLARIVVDIESMNTQKEPILGSTQVGFGLEREEGKTSDECGSSLGGVKARSPQVERNTMTEASNNGSSKLESGSTMKILEQEGVQLSNPQLEAKEDATGLGVTRTGCDHSFCQGDDVVSVGRCVVVNVYSPCSLSGKKILSEDLSNAKLASQELAWCFCGDFNAVRSISERKGAREYSTLVLYHLLDLEAGLGGVRRMRCAGVLNNTSTRPNQGCYHSEPLHAAVGCGSDGGMKVLTGMGFLGGEGDARVCHFSTRRPTWKERRIMVKVRGAGVGFVGQESIGAKGIRLLIILEKQNLNHVTCWVWFLVL
ncbi:hypothetical protein VNO80_25362 [Phaseolus coccineus]|uniref:Endonuclease/exonuclease/phosphatase domain-containing protein n=1 Tax=Phaseolus coccineus TaxID=3886 RepID=A0AAN9QQ29_PHACN